MIGSPLIIDSRDDLSFIRYIPGPVGDLPAIIWLRGFGKEAVHGVQGRRAVQRRVDPVVDERSPQSDLPAGVAGRRSESRPVSSQHRGRRNEGSRVSRILPVRCVLVPGKEKEFIPDDRAAHGSAELIALQRALCRRKIVSSVEQIVPDELKQIAVKFIRARFRNCSHCSTNPMLSGHTARLDVELL